MATQLEKIQRALDAGVVNQTDLASASGVHRLTVHRIHKQPGFDPRWSDVIKLHHALGKIKRQVQAHARGKRGAE